MHLDLVEWKSSNSWEHTTEYYNISDYIRTKQYIAHDQQELVESQSIYKKNVNYHWQHNNRHQHHTNIHITLLNCNKWYTIRDHRYIFTTITPLLKKTKLNTTTEIHTVIEYKKNTYTEYSNNTNEFINNIKSSITEHRSHAFLNISLSWFFWSCVISKIIITIFRNFNLT